MKTRNILKQGLIFALVAVLTAVTIFAAGKKDIVGSYKTQIDMNGRPAQEFTLVVKRSEDGKLSAIAEKANDDVTVSAIMVDGDNVTLKAAWRGVPFEMKGIITDEKLAGEWGTGKYSGNWSAVRISE